MNFFCYGKFELNDDERWFFFFENDTVAGK